MTLRSSLLSVTLLAGAQFAYAHTAFAEVPNVVTDMAPIDSLVVQVMGDLGTPKTLMPQGASPHGYSLRPSEAKALQAADIVFWTGPRVEPWLDEMIDEVATEAHSVPLSLAEGAIILPLREGATFERHVHGDDEHDHDHDEAGHDDHDDHDHAEEAHDDHDHDEHEHEEAHDHDHGDEHGDLSHTDGHAWLDPMNARVWLGVIAEELSEHDPENAATYAANAAAGQAALDEQIARVQAELAPISDLRFIVFHDAFQYFENRFGLQAAGSISLSDATAPSPARVKEIQDKIKSEGVTCVFSEPQFNAGLVATVLDGTEAKTTVIDPLGVSLTPGAGFYSDLIDAAAEAFKTCASE
ncbi:zinc ABC transporter substrate-binding protein [Celeribacter persicus]|uniref:High-affinity zinc uptake system protein ZnuA n=1 Tax=Celeribacter persicus TaxID=1651082 RepID=A0A2T5HPJ7_9RHOB|nr:zinc ABC transporter substrate-binding protein [Celeribacter persicus]PTQ73500.1 zinc transport system substrate-binding protein [Celeribacter persicus]